MEQVFHSNIELYYCDNSPIGNVIEINNDEVKHIARVMRHQIGDRLFITDGNGHIYETIIKSIEKKTVQCEIEKEQKYTKEFPNIVFCIPKLRYQDRFEFALEKCVELGITEFIVYEADRSVSKGEKLDRWNKIALSAMKQSLRAYKPNIQFIKSLSKLSDSEFTIVMFDQNADNELSSFGSNLDIDKKYVFVFGPEGGFSDKEVSLLENSEKVFLTKNRLRAETAVVSAASAIALSQHT